MEPRSWEISVANPSPYVRSDFVEVDIDQLGVDSDLDESSLRLCRLSASGKKDEVRFQIDRVLGNGFQKRILTLPAMDLPPGPDNYRQASAKFILEEGHSNPSHSTLQNADLWVGHYYDNPQSDEPEDGFSRIWSEGRSAHGVKLSNGKLEVYFSLVPHPGIPSEVNYTGAATSIAFAEACTMTGEPEMLSPYRNSPEKRWGQITELVFFPLPWEVRWFDRISVLDKRYDVAWSSSGPMRSVVTLRSEPFEVEYRAGGYFTPASIVMKCRLYRVIYFYPGRSFYTEEIFVLNEAGRSISFRPYYYSSVPYPYGVNTNLSRFEHVADYFAVWKDFAGQSRGFGFASDAHTRGLQVQGDEIRWRLPLSHHKRCVHYFVFSGVPFASSIDKFHDVGHYAWYEQVYKPIEALPFEGLSWAKRYSVG